MTPAQQAGYRARPHGGTHYNAAQKVWQGPCRRRRSVGQFAPGSDICIRCTLRGGK